MAESYKGIPLFENCDSQDFLVWHELFLSYCDSNYPKIMELLRNSVDNDLDGVPEACDAGNVDGPLADPDVDAGSCDDAASDADQGHSEQTATGIQDHERHGKRSHLVVLGTSHLLHLPGGIEIWKKLKMDFRHWQDSRGPALQRQYDNFRPSDTETVVAMCDRYDVLCLQLDRVGMAPAPRAAIQHFVKQLKAERPAWSGYIQGLWQVLPGTTRLNRMQPGSVLQDSGLRRQLGTLEVDEADELAPDTVIVPKANAAAAVHTTAGSALHDRLASLEGQLRRLTDVVSTQSKNATTNAKSSSRPQQRHQRSCHRCGSTEHLVRDCPHPPVGTPSRGVAPFKYIAHTEAWLVDSGTTHHMSAGNGAGIQAVSGYRAFDKPLVVQFGKRGATAPALGFGDLGLHGKGGPETLRGVLYVPELVVTFFCTCRRVCRHEYLVLPCNKRVSSSVDKMPRAADSDSQ
jgi:hypothetical protein